MSILEILAVVLICNGLLALFAMLFVLVTGYSQYLEIADYAKTEHHAHLQSAEFINSLIDTIEEYDSAYEIINGCELSLYNKVTKTHIYLFPKSYKDFRAVQKHIEKHDEYLRSLTMTKFFETYFDEKEK